MHSKQLIKNQNLFVQTVFLKHTGWTVDGRLDKLDISMLYQEAIELCATRSNVILVICRLSTALKWTG